MGVCDTSNCLRRRRLLHWSPPTARTALVLVEQLLSTQTVDSTHIRRPTDKGRQVWFAQASDCYRTTQPCPVRSLSCTWHVGRSHPTQKRRVKKCSINQPPLSTQGRWGGHRTFQD
jgi:hypothetical protein